MRLGPMEIALILVIVLVLFGVGKLPQVGSALGKSIRAFKEGQSGEDDEDEAEEEVKKPRRKQAKKTTRKAKAESKPESDVDQGSEKETQTAPETTYSSVDN